MTDLKKHSSKGRFSLRTMFIAIAMMSVLSLVFAAEYEITNVVGSASQLSPDKKRTAIVECTVHSSLYRTYRTVDTKIIMANGETGILQHHWLGPPETESTLPPDLKNFDTPPITWSTDSKSVTYKITDLESATLWVAGDPRPETTVHRHQKNGG